MTTRWEVPAVSFRSTQVAIPAPLPVPPPPAPDRPVGEAPAPLLPDAGRPGYRLASQILAILAVLALTFLTQLTLLGGLSHDRDQAQSLEDLRRQLALATAPVGPVDDGGVPWAAGTPVALLEIPRLGLREVIAEGTSSGTLMSGPGHRRDTPLPGQVGTSVIAGRRGAYGGPFKAINQLAPGDKISATTGQGRNEFRVLGVRRAGDPLPPPLTAGQGRLTLVTTDGPAFDPTDVLRADAQLTTAAQPTPAQLGAQALPAAEVVMAGDRSALLAAIGWSVLLLAAAIGTVWIRHRAGPWQAWVIGVPVLVTLGLVVTDDIAAMLPNLL